MDYTSLDDIALLRLIASRNEDALSVLYDRYSRLVYGLAYSVLGSDQAAEDVIQEVFLSLWQKAHQYQPGEAKVVTWIASITRHRAIDMLRYQRTRPAPVEADWEDYTVELEVDPGDVEAEVELAQQRQRVRLALEKLPDDQRRSLALAYFKGLSHSEIAAELGEPLGTVKTRIRLAMQKLRQLLLETETPVD